MQSVDIIPAIKSDHQAITLFINGIEEQRHGPSFWKFNASLIDDENFVSLIRDRYCTWIREIEDPRVLWDYIKYKIRQETIAYNKCKARERRATLLSLLPSQAKLAENSFCTVTLTPVKHPIYLPDFYKECLEAWSDLNATNIVSYDDVVNQTIWNNKHILIGKKSCFIKHLIDHGIVKIGDLIAELLCGRRPQKWSPILILRGMLVIFYGHDKQNGSRARAPYIHTYIHTYVRTYVRRIS